MTATIVLVILCSFVVIAACVCAFMLVRVARIIESAHGETDRAHAALTRMGNLVESGNDRLIESNKNLGKLLERMTMRAVAINEYELSLRQAELGAMVAANQMPPETRAKPRIPIEDPIPIDTENDVSVRFGGSDPSNGEFQD